MTVQRRGNLADTSRLACVAGFLTLGTLEALDTHGAPPRLLNDWAARATGGVTCALMRLFVIVWNAIAAGPAGSTRPPRSAPWLTDIVLALF